MKKLIFATRHMQDRPFQIGGRTFFSRLLNGGEEIDLTELDSLRAVTEKRSDSLRSEVALMQRLLQSRRRDKGEDVTSEWVTQELGPVSAKRLLQYLRLGDTLKPGETLDRPVLDEPIEIDGLTFVSRVTSYQEQLGAAVSIEAVQAASAEGDTDAEQLEKVTTLEMAREYIVGQMAEARSLNAISAGILADWLNARQPEGAELITAEWLLERLQLSDVQLISSYLSTGEIPQDEDQDPKAEEGDGA